MTSDKTEPASKDHTLLSHIVAADENNVIGGNNKLPWHLPNDLKYFKNRTWAMPVIMGRKTFESEDLSLAGRRNIVITSQEDWKRAGVFTAKDFDTALRLAKETDAKEIFIIGGGEIFKQTLDIVDRVYLTRVHAQVEGNVYYPELDANLWEMVSEKSFDKDEKHSYAYSFQVWEKIS